MPSISVCDTCKLSISDAILLCNLCLKEYHPYCSHPISNFPDRFPKQTYVYPNCPNWWLLIENGEMMNCYCGQ